MSLSLGGTWYQVDMVCQHILHCYYVTMTDTTSCRAADSSVSEIENRYHL